MNPSHQSRCEQLHLRGLRHNVRHWGPAEAPVVYLLHGWMDSSATFQFLVEALQQTWHVIAPDWRGYGASEWLGKPYWFPDYYADLEALLDHYTPEQPVRLVGHSMSANIAATYAGGRPHRVAQLVMLDFLGLKNNQLSEAPERLAAWLDSVPETPRLTTFSDHAALASRLLRINRRLTPERAHFLALHVSCTLPDGRIQMACDPWHRVPSPNLYRVEDSMAIWRQITAPVLMLFADQGLVHERFAGEAEDYHQRLASFPNVQVVTITDSGHNVQHDQPEQVALALERQLGNTVALSSIANLS